MSDICVKAKSVPKVCECCDEYPVSVRACMPSGSVWFLCEACDTFIRLGAVKNLGEIIQAVENRGA